MQQNLITDMGSKCPKDTTRWVAFGSIMHWLLQNYRRLMIHNAAKRPVQVLSKMWWVIAAVISPLFDRIAITFTKIQARNIVISQQRQEMLKLVTDIAASLDIRPATNEALEGVDPLTIITRSDWFILKDSVVMHIQDQGSWVRDLYNALSDTDKQTTLKEITIFGISIVANVSQVQAERDSNNNARELEAPLVMPADLVKIRPAAFIQDVLDPYRAHLSKHWSQHQIDDVEKEHRQLHAVYDNEPHVAKAFDQHDGNTFFNDEWDVVKGRFSGLRQFCGGLATAFPNMAAVESDFSIVKWEKNDTRTSLTNLALAGIMQAKQFELLKALFERQNAANDGSSP
jgi:hypothetical protein